MSDSLVQVSRVIARIEEKDQDIAIGIFNIDGASKIIEAHGYSIFFMLTKKVFNLLHTIGSQYSMEDFTLYHLISDEFVIILNDTNNSGFNILDSLRSTLFQTTFAFDDVLIHITASIGLVRTATHQASGERLLQMAHSALKAAKEEKNCCVAFNGSTEPQPRTFSSVELRQVIGAIPDEIDEENCILPFFQPIYLYSLEGWGLSGFEVLLRWRRGTETIPPPTILSEARRFGQSFELEKLVIQRAFTTFSKEFNNHPIDISLNLSPRHFSNTKHINEIIECANASKIPFEKIKIEILEKGSIKTQESEENNNLLRRYGIKIVIDDFGIESAFRNALHAPIDGIKMDREFIKGIGTKRGNGLFNTIVSFAFELNTSIVIEGIETEEQLKYLEKIGKDLHQKNFSKLHAQGFYLSRPFPPNELKSFIKNTYT